MTYFGFLLSLRRRNEFTERCYRFCSDWFTARSRTHFQNQFPSILGITAKNVKAKGVGCGTGDAKSQAKHQSRSLGGAAPSSNISALQTPVGDPRQPHPGLVAASPALPAPEGRAVAGDVSLIKG